MTRGPDFHEAVEIHLGGQTRELVFSPKAMNILQRMLDKRNPRFALLEGGEHVIFTAAACALIHTMGDKADASRVSDWITREPKKYPELQLAVTNAAARYYRTLGVIDDEGEAEGSSTSSRSTTAEP